MSRSRPPQSDTSDNSIFSMSAFPSLMFASRSVADSVRRHAGLDTESIIESSDATMSPEDPSEDGLTNDDAGHALGS